MLTCTSASTDWQRTRTSGRSGRCVQRGLLLLSALLLMGA
jgi:hypothetical protein